MSNFQKMNIMKKLLFLLLSVFTLQVAQADNDKPITFDKLPAKAQTFIKQNFPTEKVAFTKMESWTRAMMSCLSTATGLSSTRTANGQNWTANAVAYRRKPFPPKSQSS